MERYRKRPLEISAVQWLGDPTVLEELDDIVLNENGDLTITTLEGEMNCPYGWWIILGIDRELYSCEPSIFERTYEKIEE